MSTLTYNGNEYNILYIDANIGANEGDGSTPATALSTIPSPLVDKTCYIIRRNADDETLHVDLPQSWYASLYYIMFLGMPLADDPMYNLMENDAKTLWGADTGKYARVRCNQSSYYNGSSYVTTMNDTNNKTLFKTNTVRNFYASNCYFYRDQNGGSVYDNGRGIAYIFGFDYDSRFADITFNRCKFGYTQYNLENEDFINTNSDVSSDTTTYRQHKCTGYVGVGQSNSVTFNECVINHVWLNAYTYYRNSWSTGCGIPIYVGSTNCVIFTNNQYNILYRNNYNNTDTGYIYWAQNIYLGPGERSKLICKNLEINKIYKTSGSIANQRAIYMGAYDTRIDNVKINIKVMGGASIPGVSSNMNNDACVAIGSTNSLDLRNLYCDVSNSCYAFRAFSFGGQLIYTGNPSNKIENIFVRCATTSGKINLGTPLINFSNDRNHWNNNGMSDVSGNSSWQTSYMSDQQTAVKSFIAENVVAISPRTTGYALQLTRAGAKSSYIAGKVYLGSSVLDVKKHYVNISTEAGAVLEGNSYYKCDDYEANLNYTGYNGTAQISWQPQSMSSVYINKSNCILFNETPYTTIYLASSNNSFVCPNYIKSGQFFQRNEVCFCKSWNTVRTGSNSQGSLRFNNNYSSINNNSHPLIIGTEPYSGIQIVPGSIGKKILTAYIATKNMDASECGYINRLGIWVNCPKTYTDYYDYEKTCLMNYEYTSEACGWQPDNSTWSGDTNLRTYKCEIPIEVYTLDEPIDVKIWFDWYSVNGYVYVDPDFKLTDVL